MEPAEIREFLEGQGTILNPHRVEIDSDLHYVYVASQFPGHREKGKTMSVELGCYCETLVDFISLFNLGSVNDVAFIRPEYLYALYGQGDAEIVCSSNAYTSRVFYFRKQGESLFARTEDFDQHKVAVALTTPDDFIAYSKIIFTLCIMPVAHPIADA